MEFREIKTREEFAKILPVIKQDWGDDDFGGDQQVIDNFIQAITHNYRQFAGYNGQQVVAAFAMTKGFSPTNKKPTYDLTAFVVDENHRHQGIGSKIVDFCKEIALAEGAGYLSVGTYIDNYKAQAFYKKNGFKHTANFMFQSLEEPLQKKENV